MNPSYLKTFDFFIFTTTSTFFCRSTLGVIVGVILFFKKFLRTNITPLLDCVYISTDYQYVKRGVIPYEVLHQFYGFGVIEV